MINNQKCAYCHNGFNDNDRVVFSHRDTFIFKPLDIEDTVNAAKVSAEELRESRKEYLRTAIGNTFCDWGKAVVPEGAFNFRHQWCEPMRTGAGAGAHAVTKHSIRFNRAAAGRLRG